MSYQTEPVTMWFDRRIVFRQSLIQGIGTFATEAIHAGETITWVTGGLVYTSEDWQAGKVQIEAEMYNEERLASNLLIATPKAFNYYINHSCDPNAIDQTQHPHTTYYVALRDIRANEEVTTDYAFYGGAEIEICGCKSPLCRGRITPNDWTLAEFQRRYRGHFTCYMEQRMQQSHMDTMKGQSVDES
jgi:uncharacterized protein